jgi:hypothetical protein
MDEGLTTQVELLKELKRDYGAEYDALTRLPADARPGEYFLTNEMFGSVDAELMYAMIRKVKPKRIVEVGSGFSTALIARAVAEDLAEAKRDGKRLNIRFEVIDPVAPGFTYKVRGVNLTVSRLQDTDMLSILRPGDMLIVDSSHIWTEDGEVKAIIEALPSLRGVYVHFHDIFLPEGYPPQWVDRGYDEQEHLQRFLIEHPDWKVLLASNRLHKEASDELADAIRSYDPARPIGPGSFWMHAPARKAVPKKRAG